MKNDKGYAGFVFCTMLLIGIASLVVVLSLSGIDISTGLGVAPGEAQVSQDASACEVAIVAAAACSDVSRCEEVVRATCAVDGVLEDKEEGEW